MEKLTELQNVKEEMEMLVKSAKHLRTKNVLIFEIDKIKNEIDRINAISKQNNSEQSTRKITIELSQYAFDESDKFVKIYIPFEHTANLKDEDIEMHYDDRKFSLLIKCGEKNYSFKINGMLNAIDMGKSYKKIKSDTIAVFLKKEKEGLTWKFLTGTEKHLKEKKEKMFEEDGGGVKDDPNNALMNIMKKMYESGDSEMKRTIQKAWVEGQEKGRHEFN